MKATRYWDVNQAQAWSTEAGSQVAPLDHEDDLK